MMSSNVALRSRTSLLILACGSWLLLSATPAGPAWAAPDPKGPVYVTDEVTPPVRVVFVQPVYPEAARKDGVEGKVILECVISKKGKVEETRILKSDPLFDQAAVDAVKRWKFHPALIKTKPVRVYFTVIVEFKLEEKNK